MPSLYCQLFAFERSSLLSIQITHSAKQLKIQLLHGFFQMTKTINIIDDQILTVMCYYNQNVSTTSQDLTSELDNVYSTVYSINANDFNLFMSCNDAYRAAGSTRELCNDNANVSRTSLRSTVTRQHANLIILPWFLCPEFTSCSF